jgi:2-polyprenyl-3-methyl-5-hydroxy-6-metoxy-1,4-benzoquinol methylase
MAGAQAEPSAYGGKAELESLEHAVAYNDHIARCFVAAYGEPIRQGVRVLDFGAGIGTITRRFAELTGIKPHVVELDRDQREQLGAQGFTCQSRVEDYPSESFDLVMSSNVLEHIDDHVGALRAIHQRLRPGGVAVFWVPAFPLLWTTLDDRVGHVRRYTRSSLMLAFEQAGFVVRKVTHQDSLGFLAALAFKWLGTRDGSLDPRAVRVYDRHVFPLSRRLDRVTARVFGKNLLLVAERPRNV